MRSTPPTRLPADVYESAAAAAAQESRTVAQQIAHWARLGQALETAPEMNRAAVLRVLAGEGSYDLLGKGEQALVRSEWAERISARRGDLDYERAFRAEGRAYSESDDDGTVVHRPAPPDAAGPDSPEHRQGA